MCKKKKCKHTKRKLGPDIMRLYGSWRTIVCLSCQRWRKMDWCGRWVGTWRKGDINIEIAKNLPDIDW